MRFLIDNSVSWRVGEALCQWGHDAIHVREIGLSDASDDVIFGRAAAESRIIVTQDTDFGGLLASSSDSLPAVVLFRFESGKPSVQIEKLQRQLKSLEPELLPGTIVVLGETNVRIRRWRR